MSDTQYAKRGQRSAALAKGCAMISFSRGHGADLYVVVLVARRSTPMMGTERSTLSCRAILFLLVTLGIPATSRAASLEDSAKDFAVKIAATLPAGQSVSCEIRNLSALRPDEVSRIERALKAELQDRGVHLAENGGAAAAVIVTLSENWKELVWTSAIRQGDAAHAVLLAVPHTNQNHFVANAMHVTVRSQKFWEGPERILDAGEISDGHAKSWLVVLLPDSLMIQDAQTGSTATVELKPGRTSLRDPMGGLWFGAAGTSIWFSVAMLPTRRVCEVDLETRSLTQCLPEEDPVSGVIVGHPMMIVSAPAAPPPPGKGIEAAISPVCGSMAQFLLATSARDDTETDSVQVFQVESSGPFAISMELDFPGPIVALITTLDARPRAIVRNLTTGNYEAYRLALSCTQ